MVLTNSNFKGSWAGLPVAWTPEDEFDEGTYRADVKSCCEIGAPGVYTGGTTGELYAMDFDEFRRISVATIEEAHAAGKFAMIGVSSTYTRGAVKRAQYAAKIGADAIQVTLPYWMEVPDNAVVSFFCEVSAASGFLPFSIYETGRCKKKLTLEQHAEIKSALPNYLMVKANANTIGTTKEGCIALTEMGINVFGEEGGLWPSLGPYGMNGCCSAFVYYAPHIVIPMNKYLEEKKWEAVLQCSGKLTSLLNFLVAAFFPLGYYDSALDRIGGVAGGVLRTNLECRGPYPHGTKEDVLKLRKWYEENLPEILTPYI